MDDISNFKLNIQNNFWFYLVYCVIILLLWMFSTNKIHLKFSSMRELYGFTN